MFAVQSSNAADRFGVSGESCYINYYFNEDNKEGIELELKVLKENFKAVENFFKERNGYTKQEALEHNITDDMLSDYADYVLGKEILDCINRNGDCSFQAEL